MNLIIDLIYIQTEFISSTSILENSLKSLVVHPPHFFMHLVARLIMQIPARECGVAETETQTIRPRRSFKLREMEL